MEDIRSLLPLLVPVILIQLGLQIAALVDLVRRERVARLPKWLWVLIITLFNLLGPIAYFFLGREE